jgi:uncharacterized protein
MQAVRQAVLDTAIQCAGRALFARDLAMGRVKRGWEIRPSDQCFSRHKIQSGRNTLDAVFAVPSGTPRASLLICHGIGETVQHWYGVQQMLAAGGVASLVFDYAGYGHSSGKFNARRSENDAIAAFHLLEELTAPLPVSLLGFSLGSGIAAAINSRVPANSLLLCAAYTSIRDAARHVGLPRWMRPGVPPIWRARDALRACKVPVLIVHGEKDRLFPVTMAAELNACCASSCEVVLVPEHGHSEAFYRPRISYWGPVIAHVLACADGRDPNSGALFRP